MRKLNARAVVSLVLLCTMILQFFYRNLQQNVQARLDSYLNG